MTAAERREFLEVAATLGVAAEPLETPYSGRFMYGDQTRAVEVADLADGHRVEGAMAARLGRPVRFRWDHLGLQYVIY